MINQKYKLPIFLFFILVIGGLFFWDMMFVYLMILSSILILVIDRIFWSEKYKK